MEPRQALERLAASCARTEHCEDDLRRKLHTWRVEGGCHDTIIHTLRAEGYIDDARYCRAFVEDKWRFNRWGKMKIREALRRKRLPCGEIDKALREIGDTEYADALAELLRQKARTIADNDPFSRYGKLARFAMGRGFEAEAIRECLEREETE